jgi:dihydrofolate reductase
MRKVIVSNLISLDGCYAGPNGEIDWFQNIADKEFEEYAVGLINSVDTMLFGRITYELMYSYWPDAPETEDPRITSAMNSFPKIVFSTTMEKAEWSNTRVVKNNIDEELIKLKNLPGKDMVIYGSGTIVNFLSSKGIIDEYRIFVAPLILGQGKQMFFDLGRKLNLKLTDEKTFKSGLALLNYELIE